jgi:hypothetical protein
MTRFYLLNAFGVIVAASLVTPSSLEATAFDDLLDAIRIVETGGEPNEGIGAKGDNGKALGPFQIWEVYWKDAREFAPDLGGSYQDCGAHKYSRQVIKAYMNRYAKKAVENEDWQTIARIHNGGPRGHKKDSTLGYWKKVQKQLK